ncbi:MAG: hypothetical protein ACJA2E_002262 [Arenicella sp.]|jgi:hypothetical protein
MEINMNRSKSVSKTFVNKVLSAMALVAMLWLAVSSAAMAQSFTFESTGDPLNSLGGDGKNGVPYTGWQWTGSTVSVTEDGTKTKRTYSCVMMSQPPNDSLFQTHMLCDIKALNGTYSTTMGCTIIDPKTFETSCIGGLYGTGGAYEGRRGSLTSYLKSAGAKSKGTGQWFE